MPQAAWLLTESRSITRPDRRHTRIIISIISPIDNMSAATKAQPADKTGRARASTAQKPAKLMVAGTADRRASLAVSRPNCCCLVIASFAQPMEKTISMPDTAGPDWIVGRSPRDQSAGHESANGKLALSFLRRRAGGVQRRRIFTNVYAAVEAIRKTAQPRIGWGGSGFSKNTFTVQAASALASLLIGRSRRIADRRPSRK